LTSTLKAKNQKTISVYEIERNKQEDSLNVKDVEKLFKQIPDILEGVNQWQSWTKKRLTKFVDQCFEQGVFPQLEQKLEEHPLTEFLTVEQKQICYDWCEQTARTFQRSSSQVEGRNGYLAFVHKANRGMSNQRLEVLTTVHNFDIRGLDGKTPAERLFQKPFDLHFPDLFEFVLESVTSFPEPRHHKLKPLQTLTVRA